MLWLCMYVCAIVYNVCACVCVQCSFVFMCVWVRLFLCIYVKNPVASDVVRKVFFLVVHSVGLPSGHVGDSCCSILFETAEVTLTH